MLLKKKWDIVLLSFLFCFMIVSLVSISSASLYLPSYLGNLALKQFIWYMIGFLILILIARIGYRKILSYSFVFYGIGILLLLLLFPFGTVVNGSRCWFAIPGIGSFQPSEFMKIAYVLVLVVETTKFRQIKQKTWKTEALYLFKMGIIFLIPSILTFLEPDTGAVFIYFILLLFVLFFSGLRLRWFLFGAGLVAGMLAIFFFFYYQERDLFIQLFGTNLFYRIDRLLDWHAGAGFQLENALVSMGSAGLFGHGYRKTPLYFPESGTDFIFAVFTSNFGYLGALLLIIFLFAFDFYLLRMAKKSNYIEQQLLLGGILGVLFYQQIQNIGMTLGLLPITGITLPFISYGGSSLISYFILMGLVFSIYRTQKEKASTIL